MNKVLKGLTDYINESPSSFHAVMNARKELEEAGFTQIFECDSWKIKPGGKYYVLRNDSAIIAFRVPKKEYSGFMITASHSDSPCLKLKEHAEIIAGEKYIKLSAEVYGGMIFASWLDRPLSAAGRIMVKTEAGVEARFIDLKKPVAIIPSLAIHMNRETNDGYKYKKNVDLVPLFGSGKSKTTLLDMIAKEAGIKKEDILGQDIFLYNPMKAEVIGDGSFFSAPRLDDLECAYTCLNAFISAKNTGSIQVYCLYDNEEVGSLTRQGAAATFLKDVLSRVNASLSYDEEKYLRALSLSLLLSADNAHAVHPNFPDICDSNNKCYMNEGIVIKFHASQKYATDGYSAALFKCICDKNKVPYQTYFNRSDMPGGSTLGNLSNAQVSVATVDIGLPQLSMHSSYETAGVKDPEYMVSGVKAFYETSLVRKGNETVIS